MPLVEAPRRHLVGWALPPLGYSQILTIQTIGTLPRPSASHSQAPCEETGTLAGAVLVSHAAYSSRKRRNRETQQHQAKSLKRADRVAKRKLVAQPEISHALALPRSRDPPTPRQTNTARSLLVQATSLHSCRTTQTGESRRRARRKLERGLMLDAQVLADAMFFRSGLVFFCDDAGCADTPRIVNSSSRAKRRKTLSGQNGRRR